MDNTGTNPAVKHFNIWLCLEAHGYTAENGRIYGKERKPVHPTRTGNVRDVEYTEMYGPVYS